MDALILKSFIQLLTLFSIIGSASSSRGTHKSRVLYTSDRGVFSSISPSGSHVPSPSYPLQSSSAIYTSGLFSASTGSGYIGVSTTIPSVASITSSTLATVTTATTLQTSDSSSLSSPTGTTTVSSVTSTCNGIPPLETFNIQFSDGGLSGLDGQFAVLIQGGFDFDGAVITYTTAQVDSSIFTLSPIGQLVGVGFPSSNSEIANVENMVLSPGSDTNTALIFNTELELSKREVTNITERSICTIVNTVLTCVTGPNRVFYVDLTQPGTAPALRVGPTVPAGTANIAETLRILPVIASYPQICTD